MTPDEIIWLHSIDGIHAAHLATTEIEQGTDTLRIIEKLRREYSASEARSALDLATGRQVASFKFTDGKRLFCNRKAAEQASHELLARHTAHRFAGLESVADLGCGMGGDLLELALETNVTAIDRDPDRIAMASANAQVRALKHRVTFSVNDIVAHASHSNEAAAWFDPSRRDTSGRRFDPDQWSPSLKTAIEMAQRYAGAGIKLAPGIERQHLPGESELEFISLSGRLVAAVLWIGFLAVSPRQATVIRSDGRKATLAGKGNEEHTDIGPVSRYLYDPDPAIGRAQLVHQLAKENGAWQIDARVAYLSADRSLTTPFARRFAIIACLPFSERKLQECLLENDGGRVEIMRRGSPIDTNALKQRLDSHLNGTQVLTIALTHIGTEQIAIVCKREFD